MKDQEIMNNVNTAYMAARAENLTLLGYNPYKDSPCKEKAHFIDVKADESETLAAYDITPMHLKKYLRPSHCQGR
ncbi:hypothetical protein CLV98_105210 [Dyadobacter jejuensis]|uniref:Uncharacterized protein n=1 Tax=Dyadobacter jejuensis TaxID=1082580 RepID=A0A316AML2_9BACT|nr:hypothetical protein [Dyadobacter jejuensis]PWJ58030.1 hypothetical protein CLV98_105210 [Dyadobacter jejuensis]